MARTLAEAEHERRRAIVALLLVGLLWSTAGALIKYVVWPPAAIWGLRSAIAAVALLAIYRPSWRGLTATELGAALALAANTGLFILANKWTTAANAILIQYSAPAWAALLAAWWLGERATGRDWAAIGLALVGVTLFFADDLEVGRQAGNAVALLSGLVFATTVVLLRKLARDPAAPPGAALRAMILGHVIAGAIGLPFAIAAPPLPASAWAAMLALGLLQQTAPTLLYAWAIRRVTAVEGLLIPIVEPIVSPLWVWLLFAERPGPWALVGGAVVVLAVTWRGLASAPRS